MTNHPDNIWSLILSSRNEIKPFRTTLNSLNELLLETKLTDEIPTSPVRVIDVFPHRGGRTVSGTWPEVVVLPRYDRLIIGRIGEPLSEGETAAKLGIDNVHLISYFGSFSEFPREDFVMSGGSYVDHGRLNFDHQLFHHGSHISDVLLRDLSGGVDQVRADLIALRQWLIKHEFAKDSEMPKSLLMEVY